MSAADSNGNGHVEHWIPEAISLDLAGLGPMPPWAMGVYDTGGGFDPVPNYAQGLTWLLRQKRGEFIPAFLTELQLSLYRRHIRTLVVNNEIALNAINVQVVYGVGSGMKYEILPRKGRRPSDQVVANAQVLCDTFCEHNEMPLKEAEGLARVILEGEAFFQLFPSTSGILSVRAVEPEYCYSPTGDSDRDSFGIRNPTEPLDIEAVEGYWIVPGSLADGSQPQLVDPKWIVHIKHPETPSTSKRGLSAFFVLEPTLRAADDLIMSTVTMAKARGKIAWVEYLDDVVKPQAQAMADNVTFATGTFPAPTGANTTINFERFGWGSILRRPSNAKMDFPSGGTIGASDHVAVMDMVLRYIAARFTMPEYMLSSNSANANYSSTLVAESPFVLSMQVLQDRMARLFGRNRYGPHRRSMIWRQLAHAVEIGLLPASVFADLDVVVTPPSMVARDRAKEAQTDKVYNEMRVKSRKTIQQEQGLDPDQEAENFKEEGPPPGQSPPGSLAGMQPGGEARPGRLVDAREACVPNETGPGHHDDHTGHPCKAGLGGGPSRGFTGMLQDPLGGHARFFLGGAEVGEKEFAKERGFGGLPAKAPSTHPGAERGSEVRLEPSATRAFDGRTPVPVREKLTKTETGNLAENVLVAWLRAQGMTDAAPLNTGAANFPVDALEDHRPTEIKGGLVSNSKGAQQWRLTFSLESPAEREAYARMTPEGRSAWNLQKQQRIHERKQAVVEALARETGREIRPRTLCAVINPDTRVADVYEFDGFHDRIGWTSEMAQKGYRGSVKYA